VFVAVKERMALTIGQVAKAAHVNVETLRYCERRGLVPKPPRGPSLYRHYPEERCRGCSSSSMLRSSASHSGRSEACYRFGRPEGALR